MAPGNLIKCTFFVAVGFLVTHIKASNDDMSADTSGCPLKCKCNMNAQVVNCTGKKLNHVPDNIPAETSILTLNNNKLKYIPNDTFRNLINLTCLDLSQNNIGKIVTGTFSGLYQLSTLKLHNNKLTFCPEDMPSDLFKDLYNLVNLTVHGNQHAASFFRERYRDDLFQHLHHLDFLMMDGLPNGLPFGSGFSKLINLRLFFLYGEINYLANKTFTVFNLSSVKHLSFNGGQLYDIEPLAFSHFSKLQKLSLSNNHNLGLVNVSKAWYGLQFTSIKTLYLKTCVKIYTCPQTIESNFYNNLNLTYLKRLFLDRNDIIFIRSSHFSRSLPHLEYLSLRYNRLTNIGTLVKDISQHKKLRVLNMSHQDKRYSFRNKLLTEVQSIKWQISIPSTLETAIMHSSINMAIQVIKEVTVNNALSLQTLDYAHNGLRRLYGPITVNNHTRHLGLRLLLNDNEIEYLDPELFSKSIQTGLNITELRLDNNRIGLQILRDKEKTLFHSYTDLKILNLAYNGIKLIPKHFFRGLISLELLNLTGNSLTFLNCSFLYLQHLAVADISYNLITTFSKEQMEGFDMLKQTSVRVNLTGNPLICSCETLTFLTWMQLPKVRFVSKDNYECSFRDKLLNLKVFFTKEMSAFRLQCVSKVYMAAGISGFVFILLAIGVSICVFRHRWDIKFFLIRKITEGRRLHDLEDDGLRYDFDAFVVYHDDSKDWVMDQLIPNLERYVTKTEATENENADQYAVQDMEAVKQHQTFHLCLHYRDFDPGTRIPENIVEGLSKSRKVLVILTNDFFKSKWCRYEMEMAHVKCFDEGRNSIIPILLEEVDPRAMTEHLQKLVCRYSYLRWPTHEHDRCRFWHNVKKTLNARYQEALCSCGQKLII